MSAPFTVYAVREHANLQGPNTWSIENRTVREEEYDDGRLVGYWTGDFKTHRGAARREILGASIWHKTAADAIRARLKSMDALLSLRRSTLESMEQDHAALVEFAGRHGVK